MRALASGLRVQSASDDPSGLAIAETIRSRVGGLQQGVQNVQTAGNLLDVANAALATVARILNRIHSLIIESRSDLDSQGQLQSIQTEIDALLHEINKVASTAQFNGLRLFDGSLDGNASAGKPSYVKQIQSEPNADGSIPSSTVANYDGLGNTGPLVYNASVQYGSAVPSLIEFRVTGYSSNAVDPITGPIGGAGVYVQVTAYSTDPNFGAAPQTVQTSAIPVNTGPDAGSGAQVYITAPSGTKNLLTFDIANLTQNDVGAAITFITSTGQPPSNTGHALEVNYAGQEGSTLAINLPNLSTNTLGVSGISVLAPNLVDAFNTVTGPSSSNEYAADSAEARVQIAIDQVSQVQAQVGAQSVALQENADNSSVAIVNQVASESAIRDTNVGQAVTALTQESILQNLATSVLAQAQASAQELTLFLIRAI